MVNFKLNKTVKGKKFEYTVTDEKGNIISKRSSARDYVACTANGEFYFGRLDLIGKGDHGRSLRTFESFSKTHTDFGVRAQYAQKARDLSTIAYLKEGEI